MYWHTAIFVEGLCLGFIGPSMFLNTAQRYRVALRLIKLPSRVKELEIIT